MNICFFDAHPNENAGSYRIWVKDLCQSFKNVGIKSRICSSRKEISNCKDEVIIFSKSSYSLIPHITKKPGQLIGAINIPADTDIEGIDFVIVGSHEERISISAYDNVFLYPLIERKFMGLPKRAHKNSDTFKICYHGHFPHLFKFTPHLRDAIEEFSKIQKTELHIVSGNFDVSSWC